MNVFKNKATAERYDNFYQTAMGEEVDRYEKELISRLIKDVPRGHLLELGCGTGQWTIYFSEQGFSVTAVDESEAMLRIAEAKGIPNADFQKADAADLPFQNKSFSAVALITMLEFVENADNVMDEIDRVIKPGGYLILGCLNNLSELGKNKKNNEVFKDARFFTPVEVEDYLSRFGKPLMGYAVYYSPGFELLDGTKRQDSVQPAFIGGVVRKEQH